MGLGTLPGSIKVLVLLFAASFLLFSSLSAAQPNELRIRLWTDDAEYVAGDGINISITVENHDERPIDLSVLRFRVLYASLNFPVLKDEIKWRHSIQPGDAYSSSEVFSLPDYAPPGRYRIVAQLIGKNGEPFGPASAEITVEANYLGISKALGILLLYASAVLALFALIYYSRRPEKVRSYSDLLRDLEDVPLAEMFILFALVSLALFPLVLYTDRAVADSGFVFAFVSLSLAWKLPLSSASETMRRILDNHYLHAFLVYSIITVLFTYPIAFNIRTSFYGYPGDAFGAIWYLWWLKHSIFDLGVSPLYTTLVGAPNGTYMPIFTPVVPMLSLPLTYFFDEVFAYNFLILLSFVLSGLGMYLLAYHLLKDKYASLVAGIIYAFSPYHLAHSMDHLGLAQTQWFPFTILYMLKLDEKRSRWNAFIFAVFLVLTIFTDAYYALFTVLLLSFYVLYRAYSLGPSRVEILRRGFNAGSVELAAIISFVLATCAVLVYRFLVLPAIAASPDVVPKRDIYELLVYSAKPWDFFLPPVYHPVFGKYVQEFVLSHLYGSNPIEQVLYVGYAPLALSIYALYRFGRDRKSEEHRTVVLFALFGLFALSFMPPAYLPIFGLKIPFSLSYLLYQFTQSFRVMARFDVLVMISVAVLSGVSLKHLMQRERKWVFLSFVVLIVLFEYAPIPSNIAKIKRPEQNFPFEQHDYSFHTTKINISGVYSWLANQDGDFTIVEYPLVNTPSKEEIIHYRYVFYQRIHKKKLVNGISIEIRDGITDLSGPATVNRLRELRVRYLIIHEDLGRIKGISPEYKLVKNFGNALVFEIYG